MANELTKKDFTAALDRILPKGEQMSLMEPKPADSHVIYAGDCLHVLKGNTYIPDGSVDLIYIDPPWNTKEKYVSFWKDSYKVMSFTDDFRTIGDYIEYMRERMVPLVRKLRPGGTFYYHCDWHCSHYVKTMLDGLFGYSSFLSEIVWQRTSARSDSRRVNHIHDTILVYTTGPNYTFNPQHTDYTEEYKDKFYRYVEEGTGKRFMADNLTAAGTRQGASGQPWRGIDPRKRGNHWKYTIERLEELDAEGRIYWPNKANGMPRYKRYLIEMPGVPLQSIWTDIPPVQAHAKERLGYPTQKPIALLKRIINMSSNPGDVVLDAFCGCGTTIEAAQELGRNWIGIDISHVACRAVAEDRLEAHMKLKEGKDFFVWGTDIQYMTEAALARMSHDEFESWAITQLQGQGNAVKTRDGGIDGRYYPIDKITYEKIKQKIAKDTAQMELFEQIYNYRPIQVKQHSAKIGRQPIADFREAIVREGRDTGYFVALTGFTKDGLHTIKRLYKEEGLKIVPATAKQMVEGGAAEIQLIHSAPMAFDAYLDSFIKHAA